MISYTTWGGAGESQTDTLNEIFFRIKLAFQGEAAMLCLP